jgi:hypothetical protein
MHNVEHNRRCAPRKENEAMSDEKAQATETPDSAASALSAGLGIAKRLRKLSAENPSPRDCIDEAADEIERLLEALSKIADQIDCHGPGCHWCKEDAAHPPSLAAKTAMRVLTMPNVELSGGAQKSEKSAAGIPSARTQS